MDCRVVRTYAASKVDCRVVRTYAASKNHEKTHISQYLKNRISIEFFVGSYIKK